MPQIDIVISIPSLLIDHFKQHDFDPFSRLALYYQVDTDFGTKLIQVLLEEIKYQEQRNEILKRIS